MDAVASTRSVYSVADAARYLSVSEKTIRLWIQQGRLNNFRAGRLIRIHNEQLQAFMKRNGFDPAELSKAGATAVA
jgi:excisionase family DNA binding protein